MPCGLFSPSSMGHTSLMRCRSRRGAWLLASVLVVLMACGPGDNMSAPRIGDSAVDASPPDAPELIHGAELVSVQVTESVGCNEELSLIVNLRNSGTSTWTDAFYVALEFLERQPVGRNAITQHSSGLGHRLVHRNFVSEAS